MTREEQVQRWKSLAALLDKAEKKGLSGLTVAETLQIGRLYRQAAIDLSRARASNASPDEIGYLNLLASRAHGQVYQSQAPKLRPAFRFLSSGFPQLFRKHWAPILAAFAITFGTAFASFIAVVRDPKLAYSLFDENVVQYENIRLEKQKGEYKGNFTFPEELSPVMAALIIGNNILVALRAFAFGALLGLPCIYLLIYNGRMLGTLQGMMFNHGYFIDFHALILTHGVLELSAIVISGGSGLMLGWSIIAPSGRSRQASFKAAAKDAAGLLIGSCVMLVFAGLIEGYVTPHYSAGVRWTVAATTGALLAAYLAFGGRGVRAAAGKKAEGVAAA